MKKYLLGYLTLAFLSTLIYQPSTLCAQGTAFTYNGRLNDGATAANGNYDLRFTLYDAVTNGAVFGELTNTATGISNGLFTVMLDFGGVFNGTNYWLELAARTNGGGAFSPLSPRQPITPTPYAIYAANAGSAATATTASTANSVAAANISGALTVGKGGTGATTASGARTALGAAASGANADITSLSGMTTPLPVTGGGTAAGTAAGALANLGAASLTAPNVFAGVNVLTNVNNVLNGTFTGSGAGVANVDAATLGGFGSSNFWKTGGNSGTAPGANFIGTTDGQELDFKVGNIVGLRLLLTGSFPSLVGGSGNAAALDCFGTFIGGGMNNQVTNATYYSVIAGGFGNQVVKLAAWYPDYGVIGGGFNNTNAGYAAVVPGGYQNFAYGMYSFAAGYRAKATNNGVFVWSDSAGGDFNSTANNQFLIRAAGGVGIGTNNPHAALEVAGTVLAQNFIGNGAGLSTLSAASLSGSATNTLAFNPPSGAPFAVGNTNLVVNLNADLLDGQSSASFWRVSGNAGTGGAGFIGTTDSQPLDFRANNNRGLRLQYTSLSSSPIISWTEEGVNVVGGYGGNFIPTSVLGGTIAGGGYSYWSMVGGTTEYTNSVTGNFGTVGGGYGNTAGIYATVSGGRSNAATNSAAVGGGYSNVADNYGTVPGGYNNTATGSYSFAAGYNNNATGSDSIAIGRNNTVTGSYSTAMGYSANATHNYSFVWGDGYSTSSSTNRDFTISAHGGVNMTTPRGIGMEAGNYPIITREHDPFTSNAGANKAGLGRWGLFMEPYRLVAGIPGDDIPGRYFSVAKYSTNGTYTPLITVNQAGNLTCNSLTILGGADLAEPFAMSHNDISEGSVVVIDAEHPGQLKMSNQAYDTRVAGIVSGAQGVHPGIQMKQEGLLDSGKNVALSGRVYVKADAVNGSIKPGDLLTTSGNPGHAMKVADHAKAAGAILGKAMTGLSGGTGMVLVLVSLQ